MKLLRNILFPFVPIYYLVTQLRNGLYDINIFKSKEYDLPVICIGNLSVGGTGKTPMIEYLLSYLAEKYKVATLSRGYKRESKGFILANNLTTVKQLGDEPFQFYEKFRSKAHVAVDENRQRGIENLIEKVNPDVILLDDAFQHRKVKAGLNILLTTYDNLYVDDFLLPTGNLRESSSGAKRANIIVVTKCPVHLSEDEKAKIKSKLKLKLNQQLFFSSVYYNKEIFNTVGSMAFENLKNKKFTLVTGIANPKPMVSYLESNGFNFEHLVFSDHHNFSSAEIENFKSKDIILTTEKDYMRLKDEVALKDKLYYVPISLEIANAEQFNERINEFVSII